MKFDEIRQYWDQRASSDASVQSTTNDVYLRDIEFRVIDEAIRSLNPKKVMDIGCGDARTAARLALAHPDTAFVGMDYSQAMIANAQRNAKELNVANLELQTGDVTKPIEVADVDFSFTTRCLINLPNWNLQQQALDKIAEAIALDGHYLMIENFVQGQDRFNQLRSQFGLPTIEVRNHNCFFDRDQLAGKMNERFSLVSERNISSTYYIVSRVIYSRICQDEGRKPDYYDMHHKYAAELPFLGEYGPVRAMLFQKRL